jgi:CyaY protein
MTESEFLDLADQTLSAIEAAFERATQDGDIDVESSRSGNVLEIEFIDDGSKIIVNSQAPMKEIWVAARSGGFHFRREEERWINTRDGSELFTALSAIASAQAGTSLLIEPE